MKTATKFEIVSIDKLVPYARNARTHSKEQIAKLRASIREYGFVNPVIVDKDFNIIAGHGRVIAAREEGFPDVPCVFIEHLSDAQKRGYILADNRLALDAGWDNELLGFELGELKNMGFDTELTGFGLDELDKLLANDDKVKDDDFDVDKAVLESPFVVRGDVWRLGRHRLMCGDSTCTDEVNRLMDGKMANLVLTDPPYFVAYQGKAGTIKNDDLNDKDAYEFLLAAFKNMETAMSDEASIYVFYADSKGLIFRRAFDDANFKLASNCIWVKNNFTFGRSDYKWGHEVCLYGWKKSGKHKWFGDMKQSTVWHCDKPLKNADHPTCKPIPLLSIPLLNSTTPNNIVLDLFSGSFSTGIACEQTDRICYAMELDEKYASASIKRFINQVGSDENVTVERNGEVLKYKEAIENA